MRRHEALQPLSREHFNGLLLCRNVLDAHAAGQIEEVRAAGARLVAAWPTELADHFDAEEHWLIPHLRDAALLDRLERDHAVLRQCVAWLEKTERPEPTLLVDLAGLLRDHIRWEERDLYPALEASIGADGLAEIEAALKAREGR